MMHGHEKSDPAIVAAKPANKAELPAAEPVERRAGTKGNAGQHKHAPGAEPGKRVTGAGTHTESRKAKGRRRGSPRCSTTSTPTLLRRRSIELKRRRRPGR